MKPLLPETLACVAIIARRRSALYGESPRQAWRTAYSRFRSELVFELQCQEIEAARHRLRCSAVRVWRAGGRVVLWPCP